MVSLTKQAANKRPTLYSAFERTQSKNEARNHYESQHAGGALRSRISKQEQHGESGVLTPMC